MNTNIIIAMVTIKLLVTIICIVVYRDTDAQ